MSAVYISCVLSLGKNIKTHFTSIIYYYSFSIPLSFIFNARIEILPKDICFVVLFSFDLAYAVGRVFKFSYLSICRGATVLSTKLTGYKITTTETTKFYKIERERD